jgi:hypothetical protein
LVEPSQPHYKISNLVETFAFDSPAIERSVATYVPSENAVILAVPQRGDTSNSLVLEHNLVTFANTRLSGWRPADWVVHNRTLHHIEVGGIMRHDSTVYTQNNRPYACDWESKWVTHAGVMPLKRYRGVWVTVDAGPGVIITLKWQLLQADRMASTTQESAKLNGGSLWDSAIFDESTWDSGGVQVLPLRNLGKGHAIKLQVMSNQADQPLAIRQIDIEYDVLSTRRG